MSSLETQANISRPRKTRDWREMRRTTDAMSLGIEMVLAIALGTYLGYLFDGHFQTAPWGMVFFVLAGIGAAAKAVIRVWRQTRGHLAAKTRGVAEHYSAPVRAADVSRFHSPVREQEAWRQNGGGSR